MTSEKGSLIREGKAKILYETLPSSEHIIQYFSVNPDDMEKELHTYAKKLLDNGKVNEAWQVLLSGLC